MKNTSQSSNTINITDFLTNDNTAVFELDFLVDVVDFDLQNLDVPTSFSGIIYTLSPSAFHTMFNLTTTFDLVLLTQFTKKEKESKEELKSQVQKLQHEYSAFLIVCSTIYC